jgi:tetratricopeptide (TPR) repeat protein
LDRAVAHVFISYSKKHRPLTERVAALLERQEIAAPNGSNERLSVWWDKSLRAGETFHREITQQIDAARAVVVIWTEGSVDSDWVYAEAQRGASQGKLVPITERSLNRRKIPLPYSALHTDYADDEAAVVASVMARIGGTPSEDVGGLSDEQRWLLDPKAELPLPRTARVSPALLLQAKYSIVPFADLDDRRSRLLDWALGRGAYQAQATAGRVIYGPGGLGKTRLLIEIIRDLGSEGWLAGFVNRGTLDHPTRGAQLEHLVRSGHDARGLLLVIDYAEGRSEDVAAVSRLMIERERAGGAPARLVLLARAAGDWWRELSGRDANVALLFGTGEEAMDTVRLADVTPGEARLRLWQASATALKPHLVAAGYDEVALRHPEGPPDAPLAARLKLLRQEQDYARPLAIQMEALLWLRGTSPGLGERGIAPMLERMLGLERAHWEKVTEGISESALDRAVAQITLLQGVESRERAIALLQADDAYFGRRTRHETATVVSELLKLYGEEVSIDGSAQRTKVIAAQERLAPLEPDLIGEHHVATFADSQLIEACLHWIETEPSETQQKYRRALLTVLQRATQPEHGATGAGRACALLDGLIPARLPSLAADMIAVMIETPGALARIIDEHLDTMDESALAAIDEALPLQSLTLMEFSVHVANRRVDLAQNLEIAESAKVPETAREATLAPRLNKLGVRLSHVGRHEEALLVSQAAVEMYQRLAQARPDAFLPDLALSLSNLGGNLSKLGHLEDALASIRAAVDIYRLLAEIQADAFLPDLAGTLNNLGGHLANLGHLEEGLATVHEAIDIYRQLAQIHPDVFLPDLAMSLNNSGATLLRLRRAELALEAGQEAVEIFRRLAQTRPDAFLSDVAQTLNNSGAMLASLNRHEEALAATQESVEIRRRLAQSRPHAFLPDLALSLNNYGAMLSNLGRHGQALTTSQEGIDIYRGLAQTRPDAFLPELARCLGALSQVLAAAGRHHDAIRATSEGLRILAPFVERNVDAFGNLARALGSAHLAACKAIGAKPDRRLLDRIAKSLRKKSNR